jgi:hypothetical protein
MRTFIVRLVQDASGSSRLAARGSRLRGVVDEVATGLRTTFRDDQELVAVLSAALGPLTGDHASDQTGSIFGEEHHVAD